jgi:gliding motility-associated-like protein
MMDSRLNSAPQKSMAAFPKEWMVRLLLMLIAVVATREITQAQTASLQGFGGTFSQPYRSGDLVVVFGTNIFSNQSPCDQVILYTGGLVGDTVVYTEGTSVNTPLKFVRSGSGSGVDTLKFLLHKSVACSPNTFLRFRKRPACTGSYLNSNILFMATGERATAIYGVTDSTYCVGDSNVAPVEIQDNVFFSLLNVPGYLSTGNPNNLDNLTGAMNVTSSDTGLYYIRVYTDTLAPGHLDCNDDDTVLVKILAMGTESINYGVDSLCPSLTTPQALQLPPTLLGGTFSSVPDTGLTLNVQTGAITPSTSRPGTYQVTYTHPHEACKLPSITTLYIDTLNQTLFSYPAAICQGDTSESPFLTTYTPGVYSVSQLPGFTGPISIDNTTGELISGQTTLGTVRVTFTPNDPCRVVTNQNITFVKRPTADFAVGNNGVICLSTASNSVPLIPVSPSATGIWSAPGLTLGTNSIIINASTPTGGPFYVSYFKDSTYASFSNLVCEDSAVVPVMIYGPESISIEYPLSDSLYCDGNQIIRPVVLSGTVGGVYSGRFLSGSGNFLPNPATGAIDLGNGSTNASIEVSYFPNASCPDSAVVDTVVITQDVNLGIDFVQQVSGISLAVCPLTDTIVNLVNTGTTIVPIVYDSLYVGGNGSASGTFPNALNGLDFLVNQMPFGGPYPVVRKVKYGGCVDLDSVYIEIYEPARADFSYLDDVYCEGSSNPVPFIMGVGGGTFSCINSSQLNQNVDPNTGEINLTNFLAGTYIIQYTTQGASPCPDVAVDTVQFLGLDAALFNYPDDDISFCTTDTPAVVIPELRDSTSQAVWTVTPAVGLDLVYPDSGIIDISQSVPGTYIVTRSIGQLGGACNSIYSIEITILQGDTATRMSFADSVYCQSEANPLPTIVGDDSTGFFFGQVGVQVNGQTGEINLVGSQVNQGLDYYTITYRLESAFGCVVELKDSVRIVGLDTTGFAYPKEFVCVTSPLMSPSQLPNPAIGTFYMVSSAGDTVNYINPSTGDINVTNAVVEGSQRFEIFFYPIDTSCRLVAKVNLNVYEGPAANNVVVSPGVNFCDLETVKFNKAGDGYLWFYINGGNVTNNVWGGQSADEFQSLYWEDGDTVTVISYSPASDTLRDPVNFAPIPNQAGGYYVDTSQTCWEEYTFILNERPKPSLSFVSLPEIREQSDQVLVELVSDVNQTNFTWQAIHVNNIDSTYLGAGNSSGPLDSAVAFTFLESVPLQYVMSPGAILLSFFPEAGGCAGDALVDTILINPAEVPIFIPEAFTPDGDEFNDTWNIQWTGEVDETQYRVLLYNRSGGEVLNMSPLNANWRGDVLPDGVYWWVLLQESDGKVIKNGGLTIRRK